MEKITQKELIKIAEDNGLEFSDRMINYYINLNLLPRPAKTKSSAKSEKAENLFDYNHAIFMLEILKKYKSFKFAKISQMKSILGGGRYTFYEELLFLSDYIISGKLEGGDLRVCSATIRVNNRIFKNIAMHEIDYPEDLEFDYSLFDNCPFFPNYDLWYFENHKKEIQDKYDFNVERLGQRTYFSVKIPTEKEFEPKKYLEENFGKLYFNFKNTKLI